MFRLPGLAPPPIRILPAKLNNDTIRNFNSSDQIDLSDLVFGITTTFAYTPASATQGTLTVSVGGVQKAQVTLFGQMAAANFNVQSDGAGGTLVVDLLHLQHPHPAARHPLSGRIGLPTAVRERCRAKPAPERAPRRPVVEGGC